MPVVSIGRENISKAYLDRPSVVKMMLVAGSAAIESLMKKMTRKMIRCGDFMFGVRTLLWASDSGNSVIVAILSERNYLVLIKFVA